MDILSVIIFSLCLVAAGIFIDNRIRTMKAKYFLQGVTYAVSAIVKNLTRVMVNVDIECVNGIFLCHDKKNNFVAQSETIEGLMSILKDDKNKAYVIGAFEIVEENNVTKN